MGNIMNKIFLALLTVLLAPPISAQQLPSPTMRRATLTEYLKGPAFQVGGDAIGNLSLGRPDKPSGNPYFDYDVKGNGEPDVRLQASGGAAGTFGGGSLANYGSLIVKPRGANDSSTFSGIQSRITTFQYPGPITNNAPTSLNTITVANDQINAGANFVNSVTHQHYFGGTNAQGGRQGISSYLYLTSPTNADNPNRNYAALNGIATAQRHEPRLGGNLQGSIVWRRLGCRGKFRGDGSSQCYWS